MILKRYIIILLLLVSSQLYAQVTVPAAQVAAPPLSGQAAADYYLAQAQQLEAEGNFEDALNAYVRAGNEYRALRQYNNYAMALTKISNMHYYLNRYTDAVQVLISAVLPAYNKAHNKQGLTDTYGQLGRVYLANNKPVEALWFYSQQGLNARGGSQQITEFESYLGMAYANILRKEYKLADGNLVNAQAVAGRMNNAQLTARVVSARHYLQLKQKGR